MRPGRTFVHKGWALRPPFNPLLDHRLQFRILLNRLLCQVGNEGFILLLVYTELYIPILGEQVDDVLVVDLIETESELPLLVL